MAYIIDLTLVMDQLFLNVLVGKPPRLLTIEQIEGTLTDYRNFEAAKVHHAIREYANKATFPKILQADNAQEKIIELIYKHAAPQA
jgi:hypothetical protein